MDWHNDILAFAFGVMGMTPREFYRLTWNQYLLKCRGYAEKGNDEKRTMRFMLWSLMSCHIPKMPPIERFWPLASDKIESIESKAERIKKALISAGKKL